MLPRTLNPIALALAGAALVSAHGDIARTLIDGVEYERGSSFNFFKYLTPPRPMASWFVARQDGFTSQDPIHLKDFATYDAICGRKSIPGALAANHTAGTEIVDTWRQWPDHHFGWFWYHVAYCGGGPCADVDPESLEWVTVQYEDFLGGRRDEDGDRYTAGHRLHETLRSSVRLPTCLRNGEWVLKATANSQTKHNAVAEIYTQCININIQGGGDVVPPGIPGRELFQKDHPGFTLRLWNETAVEEFAAGKYGHPGGEVFTCSASGDATSDSASDNIPSTDEKPAEEPVPDPTSETSPPTSSAASQPTSSVDSKPAQSTSSSNGSSVSPSNDSSASPYPSPVASHTSQPSATQDTKVVPTVDSAGSESGPQCNTRLRKRRSHRRHSRA